jgi:tRNA A37 threonylcarbamoyladenosine biosynthesis protein TsaE
LSFLKNKFTSPVKERLVQEVKNHDVLIIVGETGSGKTTRKFFNFAVLLFVDVSLNLLSIEFIFDL